MIQNNVLPGFEILRENIGNNGNNDNGNNYSKHMRKGMLGEILFDCLCLKKGWQSCAPIEGYTKIDRLVIMDGDIKKVQIKTANLYVQKNSDGSIRKRMLSIISRHRSSKRNHGKQLKYEKGDYDLLFIPTKEYCWLIPFEKVEGITSIYLDDDRWNKYIIYKTVEIFGEL